ncbi:histidine kinase [Nonomuraea maheshkhaliensis]|uniref:histidine kinase n=1 Tax=Nonomuraea maheshkhaliensis TaxID=419590 RepID=A0ABP4RVA8_9ACTN
MIDTRRVKDLWRRCDVTVRDFPVALFLTVVPLLPEFQGNGTQVGGLPTRPYDALAILVVALECLPLTVRRRWPIVCVALVSVGFTLDQVFAYHSLGGTALPFALVSVGAHLLRGRRVVMVLLSLAYLGFAYALDRAGGQETPANHALFYLSMVLAWGVGAWLRNTRAAEAERRRHVAEATRAAERTRIARELHDVVTHHVTAIVVQAEAARYLTAAPDRLDATLSAVTDTGRRAITDLRNMLDVLDPGHDSGDETPAAGDLRALVEQTRQAGQPVEFAEEGEAADPSGGPHFVIYRVVQESLTNALKYAHGAPTVVRVRHGENVIEAEVANDGTGSRSSSPGGSGRGLAGLQDRVEALGGEFSAAPQVDGGFVVRAHVPTQAGEAGRSGQLSEAVAARSSSRAARA